MGAGVAGQHSDVVEPWLWFDVVDVDDWIEFILLSVHSMGERLRLTSGDAGVGGGTGDVQADDVADVNELRSEENDGAGLISGLGYGVRFRLLPPRWPAAAAAVDDEGVAPPPPLPPPTSNGVGLVAKRLRHEGDGERGY